MKEQDLKAILKDFATRIQYARENMKKDEKGQKAHLKSLFEAKDNLLVVIENSVDSIMKSFDTIEVLDKAIDSKDRHAEKLSKEEISKYDKE